MDGDEHEHGVSGGIREIAIERGARILSQRCNVAHDHGAPLGHHRRRAQEAAERLCIDLGGGADVEIEVTRDGIDGGIDELTYCSLLEEIVFPMEVVDALERAAT